MHCDETKPLKLPEGNDDVEGGGGGGGEKGTTMWGGHRNESDDVGGGGGGGVIGFRFSFSWSVYFQILPSLNI